MINPAALRDNIPVAATKHRLERNRLPTGLEDEYFENYQIRIGMRDTMSVGRTLVLSFAASARKCTATGRKECPPRATPSASFFSLLEAKQMRQDE